MGDPPRPSKWKSVLLRLFGLLHLIYVGLGFYLVTLTLLIVSSRGGWTYLLADPIPYYAQVYAAKTATNIAILTVLAVAAVLLLRLKANAVRVNNWLFGSFVVYFLADVFVPWGPFDVAVGVTGGVGNMGIAPMIITGYPLICLVALNLLGRKNRQLQDKEPVQ